MYEYVRGHTHSKPEVNADCEAPCWVHILDALPDKSPMDWFVCCHFTDGRILGVNNDSREGI